MLSGIQTGRYNAPWIPERGICLVVIHGCEVPELDASKIMGTSAVKSRDFQLTGGYIGYQWVSCFFLWLYHVPICSHLLQNAGTHDESLHLWDSKAMHHFPNQTKQPKNNSKSRWPWRMERMPPINSQQTAVLVGFHATLVVEKFGSHQRNKWQVLTAHPFPEERAPIPSGKQT